MSPRIVCDAFLDPSNTASSLAASPSRCINEYLESITPGEGKSKVWSVRRPGLHPYAYFGAGPVRGLFNINERIFAVSGVLFAEVFSDGTTGHHAIVANDGRLVSMASNGSAGNQVLVLAGGLGYIYDLTTNVLTAIADPDFPTVARTASFMDGYFIVSKGGGSRSFSWSALEDGTDWPALNVAERSEAADNILAVIRNHRELWIIGGSTTEVWYDAGPPDDFAPMQGVFVEMGGQGIFTPQRIDNALMWMGRNENGQGMVVRMNGYTPERVSTHAVETALQLDDPNDAYACVFQLGGHTFYLLTLPRQELSWVYDVTTQRWFEWGHWDPTAVVWRPFIGWNQCTSGSRVLVGSRVDGTIYELSPDFVDDQLRAVA